MQDPYVQRSNARRLSSKASSPFDHFSLPPCTRGRRLTAPFSDPRSRRLDPVEPWPMLREVAASKGIRGELVLDARGAVEHHCPSVKDEGDLRPRRRAGRSPKEGDRSSTVAESGRTGCGSSRGTRSRSGSREEVTQRSYLASPDGGVRWPILGQQRSTRCAREVRAQTV